MKKYLTTFLSLAILAAFLQTAACKSKKTATTTEGAPCSTIPTYTAEIKNIIDLNCANECHNAKKKKHNIDISTYDLAKAAAANRNFMGTINHLPGYDPMPDKKPKLDDVTIQKLTCWIQNGMPQ